MKFQIQYRAGYSYAEEVSLSPHEVRIFPRQDLLLRQVSLHFEKPESADGQMRRDLFDNDIARLFFPRVEKEFVLSLDAVVETPERNPFHFLLEERALQFPVGFAEVESRLLAAYFSASTDWTLPAQLVRIPGQSVVEQLVNWTAWCHREISYERREEGEARDAARTLELLSGSCRDFAVFFAEVLRTNGLPARLASGFLWEGDVPAGERVSTGAMHAWVETWLPGAGWIGIDPTNGIFCDHHFVTTAVGLSPQQIRPVDGTYFSDHRVETRLQTQLSVERIDREA